MHASQVASVRENLISELFHGIRTVHVHLDYFYDLEMGVSKVSMRMQHINMLCTI